jgi:peptidoglycan hydrolase-like protein with peptidoglycan-binding domain
MIRICKDWKNIALSLALMYGVGAFCTLAQAQDDSAPQARVSSRSMLRSAQQQLKSSGYYTGKIDGMNGPMTRTAIRKYQTDNNLTVNGRLDTETVQKLGLQQPAGEASRSASGTATGTSPAPALPSATVSAAQRSLQEKGFYKGNVDGAMTPETQAAIREYQKNSNLNVTGQLDQATLSSLGVSK